ncbi:4-(cytidine 5'-diphospho)-2-C-methyl-D-erythritol kinase [Mobiluncus curtisii]|uniref:4-diphosphocytidyl-2-C-methyl-D-erythritol kinase n=1 Tax=Mobiluncus curtisii TaxID=2051 RepID=A0A7Y0UFP8_9ACTO|nr:4-(cytidine 5'-diphospho)-2-C-methyl-D-erythritol kinase [Mobiluncus curtisii]MCU9986728.1 4-(cytidine 5'-diphospho)-2-C-methyl-D-erythritol kinase [Mobiluncus curtisii]MCU9999629.1 4-(cytidine 5'-diphospho)-2-C-methyl-D-erythritol kinase [Mobiluncus curtisii]NMW49392.1 4-(cytidine 5'-diphospho)-2-C-methyl-D-erythritol kinase [Mobiluncus curtisii]NMW86462.1 4-(cytidine 5'-diphospho)-2-C-methyl-D-erythritol kinase [Mobiluncus curtisii]NMX13803.1 4-(cytidine 5'-diphospho)-2-C-methyl-D-erythri
MSGVRILENEPGRRLKVFAPGKVNLLLQVGQRPAGQPRHELLTVFQCLDLGEYLTVEPRDAGETDMVHTVLAPGLTGPKNLDGPENLALKAVQTLRETGATVPFTSIKIEKNIPVAGGMAGGSADAAGVLYAVNQLYELGLTSSDLQSLGAKLGADVPYGLTGGNALGLGFGDRMQSLPVGTKCYWVLAVSPRGLSTPEVFKAFDRMVSHPQPLPSALSPDFLAALDGNPAELAGYLHNDLQTAALSIFPELSQIIVAAEQSGALKALVSGSGPTVAALCPDASSQKIVAARLEAHPLVACVFSATGPVCS